MNTHVAILTVAFDAGDQRSVSGLMEAGEKAICDAIQFDDLTGDKFVVRPIEDVE